MSSNIQSKILSSMVQYLLLGIGLYFIALILGTIAKVLFGVSFLSYQGIEVDVVTYIGYGAIDLILTIIQILLSSVLVGLGWIWDKLLVDVLFRWFINGIFYIILQEDTFAYFPHLPQNLIPQFVEAFAIIKEIFSITAWDILSTGATVVEDGVKIVVGGGTRTR